MTKVREIREAPAGLRYSSERYAAFFRSTDSDTGSPRGILMRISQVPSFAVTHAYVLIEDVTRRVDPDISAPLELLIVAWSVNERAEFAPPVLPANSAPRVPRPVPIVPPPHAVLVRVANAVKIVSKRAFIAFISFTFWTVRLSRSSLRLLCSPPLCLIEGGYHRHVLKA